MQSILSSLSLLTLLFLLTHATSTDFISYHVYPPSGPTSSQCYPNSHQSEWAGYITANAHGLGCGDCVKMTEITSGKSIFVFCVDSGGRGFDLNLPAFCELCGDVGGFEDGGCNVNWLVVDGSLCDNWISNKKAPDCNPCPTGTVCGNPDGSAGVPWDVYCPQDVGFGMNRCDMKVDGCHCYYPGELPPPSPESSSTSLPPPYPPKSSPPPSIPLPSTPSTTRCGKNWNHAASNCLSNCNLPEDCSSNYTCFSNLPMKACPASTSTKTKTTTRCGTDWNQANTQCNDDCTSDTDCSPSLCFNNLAPCTGIGGILSSSTTQSPSTMDNTLLYSGVGVAVGVVLIVVVGVIVFVRRRNRQERV